MFSFKYTHDNLKNLTFATCLFGGILWTSKYLEMKRNFNNDDSLFESKKKSLCKLDFYDNISVKTLMSAFYFYFALNVNSFLMQSGIADLETLIRGYSVVMVGVALDAFKYLEVPTWTTKFWRN